MGKVYRDFKVIVAPLFVETIKADASFQEKDWIFSSSALRGSTP